MVLIQATLTHIKFERDGFIIGAFQDGKTEFSGLGNILRAEIGMNYKLTGKWSNNKKFGRQYKFSTYESIIPKDVDAIYRYIVRVARWVGPKTGKAIIAKYGKNTLDVLRDDPDRVASDIKGITIERAKEIQSHIIKNQEIEGTLVALEKLIGDAGLRQSLPMDLIQKWGANSIPILKENPYRLIEMKQIGFQSADKLAVDRFKVKPQSVFRQQAAVIHAIREKMQAEGHVWVDVKELIHEVKLMIRCDPRKGLALALENKVVVSKDGYMAIRSVASDETNIADKIKELLG